MAELKHTFRSGRMNKDFDERLLPNGEYRDALNVHISASENGNAGAVENILGNKKLSSLNLKNPKAIGSVADTIKNRIYWLVASDFTDAIYEYDQDTDKILPVIIDNKDTKTKDVPSVVIETSDNNELTMSGFTNSVFEEVILNKKLPANNNDEVLINNNIEVSCEEPYLKTSIPKNTVIRKEDDKYVFKNIFYDGGEFGNANVNFSYTIKSILNFSKNNLVTGINIIDGMLFWTDNLNEPRKINISKFKKLTNTTQGGEDNVFEKSTRILFKDLDGVNKSRDLKESDITVAKKAPISAPTLIIDSAGDDKNIVAKVNFFQQSTSESQSGTDRKEGLRAKIPGDSIEITKNDLPEWSEKEVKIFGYRESDQQIADSELIYTGKVSSIENNKISIEIITKELESVENENYEIQISLSLEKPLYELEFVRFAYRWRYEDGEYSAMSPFSEPAFVPGDFKYDGKEGFNLGMTNTIKNIVLTNMATGREEYDKIDGIKEIEVLFKETRNQNIYTLEAKKIDSFIDDLNSQIKISKKQIHSVLPNDQLLRSWDAVPKRAKAQEITANRLIYGNYTQNYDIYNDPAFNVEVIQRGSDYKRTIKSDRTYQIGVSYIDEFNRHSPIITSQSGAKNIDKSLAEGNNGFKVKLTSNPPAWAKYFKYYIKENSAEYYNLAADRFYTDKENGFTYVSFPSSERNKVTNESYLLLKKQHGQNLAVTDKNNRYKIIDIFSEAPDFVATKVKSLATFDHVKFAPSYSSGAVEPSKKTNATPVEDSIKVQIESIGSSVGGSGADVSDEQLKFIKAGNYMKFKSANGDTKAYEISGVKSHTAGETEVEIIIKKAFGKDVNILYVDDSSDADLLGNISLEILEKNVEKGAREFDGRFFVKLVTSGALKSLNKKVKGKNYLNSDSFILTGRQAISEIDGKGVFGNAVRMGSRATSTPKKPIFIPGLPSDGKFDFRIEETTVNVPSDNLEKFQTGLLVSFSNDEEKIYRIKEIKKGDNDLRANFSYRSKRRGIVQYRDIELSDIDGNDVDISSFFPTNKSDTKITINFLKEVTDEEVPYVKDPAIFETEPLQSETDLNIYYETSSAFDISQHSLYQTLKWYNAISFGNGIESNRIRDDFNAVFISNGVKASATIAEQIQEEQNTNGIIYSGIINSKSKVNKSNEFNIASPITKDLLPSYGSIQKFHAWDNALVVMCEDKVVRLLANKSALYNADGSANLISDSRVLGDSIEYGGDFGISQNPESFASYGFRCYFADKARGAVIRLSKDGLTPISDTLLSDFFKDRFFEDGCYNSSPSDFILGSYDEYNGMYNLSFEGQDTVCFNELVNGWVTRKSYLPQWAISLNNKYYSYDFADLYLHDVLDAPRNNFYGTQYNSYLEFEINDDPSVIKKYKTLGYEGTSGWNAVVKTDQSESTRFNFAKKENKYFSNIPGRNHSVENIELQKFNFQGIGNADTVSSVGEPLDTTVKFILDPQETVSYTSKEIEFTNSAGENLQQAVEFELTPKPGYVLKADMLKANNLDAIQNQDGIIISYNHGIPAQPTKNITKVVQLCKINFSESKTYNVSGEATYENVNTTSTKEDKLYSIFGNKNQIKLIETHVIKPKKGYEISEKNIKCNNPRIQITKKLLKNGNIRVLAKSIINDIDEFNIDYKITSTAKLLPIINKKISHFTIDTSDVNNAKDETRNLRVYGEKNAVFSYVFKNTATDLDSQQNITIGDDGYIDFTLTFESGASAETFTILFSTPTGSEFDKNFTQTQNIYRRAKTIKNFKFFSQFKSTISKDLNVKGFTGDNVVKSFSQYIDLPVDTYTLKRQPAPSDISFSKSAENIIVNDLSAVYDPNPHPNITITGTINISDVKEDVTGILNIANIVGSNSTLTVDYNKTISGGAQTSNYSFSPASYAITGASNLLHPEEIGSNEKSKFTLTPSSGYNIKSGVSGDDFAIYDGVTDVTSEYALDDRLYVDLEEDNLIVYFKLKEFTMPVSNTTITIRPKVEIAEVTSTSSEYYVDFEIVGNGGEFKSFTHNKEYTSGKKVIGPLTDSSNQSFLFQVDFVLDKSLTAEQSWGYSLRTVNSSMITINPESPELSKATSGTYTDIYGNSKTITGPITQSYSSNNETVTLNILANINSDPSKKMGKVKADIGLEFAAWGGPWNLSPGGCSANESNYLTAYSHGSTVYPRASWLTVDGWLTDGLVSRNTLTKNKTAGTQEYKIVGENRKITTRILDNGNAEKIIDISDCNFNNNANDSVSNIVDETVVQPERPNEDVNVLVSNDDFNSSNSTPSVIINGFEATVYENDSSSSYISSLTGIVGMIDDEGGTVNIVPKVTKSTTSWENLTWTATTTANWVTFNTSSGSPVKIVNGQIVAGNTLTATIAPNTTSNERTATINFTLTYNGVQYATTSTSIKQDNVEQAVVTIERDQGNALINNDSPADPVKKVKSPIIPLDPDDFRNYENLADDFIRDEFNPTRGLGYSKPESSSSGTGPSGTSFPSRLSGFNVPKTIDRVYPGCNNEIFKSTNWTYTGKRQFRYQIQAKKSGGSELVYIWLSDRDGAGTQRGVDTMIVTFKKANGTYASLPKQGTGGIKFRIPEGTTHYDIIVDTPTRTQAGRNTSPVWRVWTSCPSKDLKDAFKKGFGPHNTRYGAGGEDYYEGFN